MDSAVESDSAPTLRQIRIPDPPSIRPSTPIIIAHPDRLNLGVVVNGHVVDTSARSADEAQEIVARYARFAGSGGATLRSEG